jgi:hypothetical protein
MLSKSNTVRRADSFLASPIGEELALLNTRSNIYFTMDQVGKCVWDLLQKPQELTVIISEIAEQYRVAMEAVERDILHFVSDLHDHGLIEIVEQSPESS